MLHYTKQQNEIKFVFPSFLFFFFEWRGDFSIAENPSNEKDVRLLYLSTLHNTFKNTRLRKTLLLLLLLIISK